MLFGGSMDFLANDPTVWQSGTTDNTETVDNKPNYKKHDMQFTHE